MLKTKWVEKKIKYDGTQLRSLYAYLEHGVLGDSVIAFRGPCNINFNHMVDGEDLLARAQIKGSDMVHFITEFFDQSLIAGVFWQRLAAAIASDVTIDLAKRHQDLHRSGDDLYVGKKKLSISVATRSTSSILIHFAVNISNRGTPVPTVSLEDFGIHPEEFANACLTAFAAEYESIVQATHKVRSVP